MKNLTSEQIHQIENFKGLIFSGQKENIEMALSFTWMKEFLDIDGFLQETFQSLFDLMAFTHHKGKMLKLNKTKQIMFLMDLKYLNVNSSCIQKMPSNFGLLKSLVNFNCFRNSIECLDVSRNIHLIELDCGMNNLVDLDLSTNLKLESLICHCNGFENLDLSKNIELERLFCSYNENLDSIKLSKSCKITMENIVKDHHTKIEWV